MYCKERTFTRVLYGITLTAFSVLLGSCANTQQRATPDNFGTFISQDGFKLFELRFARPARSVSIEERQRETSPQQEQRRLARQRLNTLEATIEVTGFCSEGYTLLGRYAGETVERIRGECRERATEDDRQTFPNNITRW